MKHTACYHLPGLFEFYELYRLFLPLFREHREYFYDWCEIGSIYGAPPDCIWGGGRVEAGEHSPRRSSGPDPGIRHLCPAHIQQFPAPPGAPLRPEMQRSVSAVCPAGHCAEWGHRSLRAAFELPAAALPGALSRILHHQGPDGSSGVSGRGPAAGVPVCRAGLPAEQGLRCPGYALPARKGQGRISLQRVLLVRLHRAQALLRSRQPQKIWGRSANIGAPPPARRRATAFPRRWKTPGSSALRTSGSAICRWAFPISSWKGAGWAARWCWSFCSII